ncbi:hypothetical protein GCM10027277_36490 [Pseudoduganella ginsengisoli]|uniref:YCII-related domain-containing protein n=1 Tax=Pseudoduganella ginsengisoli TaxID=1462440 RepID=A0A6L6PXU3_9BURK|nr:YciI family protein [Pseudoduganella ginsengisoli]MTW02270.1 hypothetical protein [Pseudoduganella ginsengisoli]
MQFMVLRRSDQTTEAEDFPLPQLEQALPDVKWLHPSASGVRMQRAGGQWSVTEAPFAPAGELVAGYTFIEADSREQALAWAAGWPTADGEGNAVLEVREAGCPGGCVGFDTGAAPATNAYAVLLRSDDATEADLEPPPAVIDTMNRANQAGVIAGIALAGEGLKSTARGGRVKFSGGKPAIIDGPFAEVKELIAGYWLIQADTLEQAMAWVRSYPFPHPDALTVELRTVHVPASA